MEQASRLRLLALCCGLTLAWACAPQGTVGQGRVIAFDAGAGSMTVIEDSNPADPGNPRYDVLPPRVIEIPRDSRSMGPLPVAGGLLRMDLDRGELVIFDSGARALKTIRYSLVSKQDGVYSGDPRLSGKHFPLVDRQAKTVTLYSPQRRALVTVSVPEEFLALPAETWTAGDEVRYYYKVPGQALRVMNVTRTDLG